LKNKKIKKEEESTESIERGSDRIISRIIMYFIRISFIVSHNPFAHLIV